MTSGARHIEEEQNGGPEMRQRHDAAHRNYIPSFKWTIQNAWRVNYLIFRGLEIRVTDKRKLLSTFSRVILLMKELFLAFGPTNQDGTGVGGLLKGDEPYASHDHAHAAKGGTFKDLHR